MHVKDCGHGEWIGKEGGGLSWCDPFKDWATVYSYVYWPLGVYDASLNSRFNPYANLTDSQYPLVLGGECLDRVRCGGKLTFPGQVSSWNEQVCPTCTANLII